MFWPSGLRRAAVRNHRFAGARLRHRTHYREKPTANTLTEKYARSTHNKKKKWWFGKNRGRNERSVRRGNGAVRFCVGWPYVRASMTIGCNQLHLKIESYFCNRFCFYVYNKTSSRWNETVKVFWKYNIGTLMMFIWKNIALFIRFYWKFGHSNTSLRHKDYANTCRPSWEKKVYKSVLYEFHAVCCRALRYTIF